METEARAITWKKKPKLKNPILIAAFEGWNDGGQAPTSTLDLIIKEFDAEPFAEMDPEDFYVFSENRPAVKWVNKDTREISWQKNEFYHGRLPGMDQDVVFFKGIEPNLRWRTYCANLLSVAKICKIQKMVTLGAYLADVLYTLPVMVNGFSSDAEVQEKYKLERSNYEGPTGIVGVMGDYAGKAGLTTISLWAAVPYYISIPNPKATHALLSKLKTVLGFEMDLTNLEKDSDNFDNEINDVVAKDPSVAAYVRELKKREFLN